MAGNSSADAISERLAEDTRARFAEALAEYGDPYVAAASLYCSEREMRMALAEYGPPVGAIDWMQRLPIGAKQAMRRVFEFPVF